MKSKRSFIVEANDLFGATDGRVVTGDILIHEWKSSEVWKHFDMLNYRLTDADKMPMMIWDSGSVFPKTYQGNCEARKYLNEGYLDYCKSALLHTERLLEALKVEVKQAELNVKVDQL